MKPPLCKACGKPHLGVTREAEAGFRALGFSWADIKAIRAEIAATFVEPPPDDVKTPQSIREAQRRYYLRRKALATGTPIPPEARRRRIVKNVEEGAEGTE